LKKWYRIALVACWIVICVAVILIALTRSTSDAVSESPTKPKLRLMAFGNYKVKEFLQEAVGKFEEELEPSFVVQLEVIPTSFDMDYYNITGYIPGYEQLLLAEFAAGDPPDLFFLPPAREEIYKKSGALLDISPCTMVMQTYHVNQSH
jgi:ABC-type glycerol-3-phosphate transport system substrate-binding protein